jgi:hypothetical protein
MSATSDDDHFTLGIGLDFQKYDRCSISVFQPFRDPRSAVGSTVGTIIDGGGHYRQGPRGPEGPSFKSTKVRFEHCPYPSYLLFQACFCRSHRQFCWGGIGGRINGSFVVSSPSTTTARSPLCGRMASCKLGLLGRTLDDCHPR